MFPPPYYSESSQGQINASTEEIKTVKIIVLFPSERFFIPGITEHKKLKVNPDKTAKKTGLDFESDISFEEAAEFAKSKGIKIENHWTSNGYILNALFEEFCESDLIQPTFVHGHPIEISK